MKTLLLTLFNLLLLTKFSDADDALAFQLACIDAGKKIEKNDPRIEIYQTSLASLSKIYKITESQVGDQTWYCVKHLQDKGVKISGLEIMQEIEKQGDEPVNKTDLAYMKAVAILTAMIQANHEAKK
jgi:hypothetical protein